MALAHLAPLLAIWTGVRPVDVLVAAVLYVTRMFAVTAGYHRYFSHRAFELGRFWQFLLAFAAQTSAQRGVLWWAAHHRVHHKRSDQPGDVHSPVQSGLLYAHILWLYHRNDETRWERVSDLAKYPELRFLNRYWLLPPALLAAAVYGLFGLSGLLVGFFASTVALWHSTFTVNSLCHVWGRRRFATPDQSRNNALLALLTLGEGWHNNHHRYPGAARQGFYWWEFDPTYYMLRILGWLRLVRRLREPPARILQEGRKVRRILQDKLQEKGHEALRDSCASLAGPRASEA